MKLDVEDKDVDCLQEHPRQSRRAKSTRLVESKDPVLNWKVPVRIVANGQQLDTCALIDSGASSNFVAEDVADYLGLQGPTDRKKFLTFSGAGHRKESRIVQLTISSRCGTFTETVTALAAPKLHLRPGTADPVELKKRWPHLKDVGIESTIDQQVSVLIGIGVASAHQVFETILPPSGCGPRAIRTHFGWIAVGDTEPSTPRKCLLDQFCQMVRDAMQTIIRSPARLPIEFSSANGEGVGLRRPSVLFCIVPVRVSANGKRIDTFALLDSGSTGNYMAEELANAFPLRGSSTKLVAHTLQGIEEFPNAQIVNFTLGSRCGTYSESVGAFTRLKYATIFGQVDPVALRDRWDHLKDIDIVSTIGRRVTLLISIGVSSAHQVFQTVLPPDGIVGPRAILTPFGWIAVGDNSDHSN